MTGEAFRKLQVRLADPLLTALTVMIAVLLFVVAPLQIAGAITGHYVGFVFEAVPILAAFMVLVSRVAFTITGVAKDFASSFVTVLLRAIHSNQLEYRKHEDNLRNEAAKKCKRANNRAPDRVDNCVREPRPEIQCACKSGNTGRNVEKLCDHDQWRKDDKVLNGVHVRRHQSLRPAALPLIGGRGIGQGAHEPAHRNAVEDVGDPHQTRHYHCQSQPE
jgi:hypothetical protein